MWIKFLKWMERSKEGPVYRFSINIYACMRDVCVRVRVCVCVCVCGVCVCVCVGTKLRGWEFALLN